MPQKDGQNGNPVGDRGGSGNGTNSNNTKGKKSKGNKKGR